MKETILLLASILLSSGVALAQYDDDIYYNPNKAAEKKAKTNGIVADGRNYNPNLGESAILSDSDIDAYNGYGGYYISPIDTIGSTVANSEDFVYTQQIQKYYNPTIVTNNSAVLADVLQNSYGNVSVIYQGGTPLFSPYYYSWYDPWYGVNTWSSPIYCPSWYWNNWYWGSSWGWAYNPWYWDSPWYYPGYSWAWTRPTYHYWNDYHRNPGAGRPSANHRYNTGLGRGGNSLAGTTSGYRRPSGLSTTSSSVRPTNNAINLNSHRGNTSSGVTRPNTISTTTSHRGNGLDNAATVRNNSTNSSITKNNNNSVITRNNNSATYRNTNTTNNRNSGTSTYRNSTGSSNRTGGFSGGSGSRMGGGGSRGGGGHRR